jgi:hypothetical protein
MDIHSKGGLINKIEGNEEIKQEIENEYDRQVQQATESKADENIDEAIQRGDTGRQGTVETPEIANDSDINAEKPTLEQINKEKEKTRQDEANKRAKARSVQENSELDKKTTEVKKTSRRGKTPLDKRQIKDTEMLLALKQEVFDAFSLTQQYFIGGGRVLFQEVVKLLDSNTEARIRMGYVRSKDKRGATIDDIAHYLWETYGENLNIDSDEFRNAVEDVILSFNSTKAMALDLNSRFNEMMDDRVQEVDEEFLEEAKALEILNQEEHAEALSLIDVLTDEEIIRLAEDKTSFEQFLIEEEKSIQKNIEEQALLKEQSEKPSEEIQPEVKSIELKEAEENIEKALARLQSAREALKNKGKALDKELIKDQEDIFGQRKSDNENLLFNERVDADARNKATENERNEVKKASEALEKAKQAREDILAGKKPLTQNIFDQAIQNLDKLDKDLRDFGRQTLGINIPIIVVRGAIQAMKVAMKTTKVGAEVLKAGIEYIKTTEWYQKLSDVKKEKITTENLKSFLVKSVKINQEQEDKIDSLLQKIQDKKLNSKQAHDEIVQFIKHNEIEGLIRTRQMNALIRKALDILTARDVYKAVQNFKDYYIQVKNKVEEIPLTDAQKKELRQNRIQNDVEFFFQQGMTLDEILQQTNDNGVLIFSSKEDIKYATTIFHNLNAKNVSDKEHYENYIRKVEEGKQAILDAQKKKFKFSEFWNKTIVGLFKSDRNADIALEALGKAEKFASSQLSKQQERLIAMRGMSAKAEQILKEIELSVYGDDIPLSKKTIELFKKNGKRFMEAMKNNSLTSFEKAKLDEVIQLKTFISIDKHRRENGITEQITHPAYTGENQAEGALRHLREKLGDKLMDELEKRADIYFDGMRKILDMLEESGMIDKDTREFFFTRNYQPRKFVHHMLESADENVDVQSTTFGINSKDPIIQSLDGGSAESLVVDSQFLLSMAIISVTKQTAQNKLNKSIFDRLLTLEDEYKKAKQKAEAQRTKQEKEVIKTYETLKDKILLNPIVRVLENGTEIRQYSNETMPKNMKRVYFRTKGMINEFLMDKSLFDEMMGNNIINKLGEPYVFDPLLNVSGTFVEFAKMLNTGRNPFFFIKNTPRDFVATLLLSPEYSNFKPLATLQLSKDLTNAGINISKGTITNEGINLLRLYVENGGGMGFQSTQGQLIRSAGTVYANEITKFEKVFNTFFKNKRAKEKLVSLFDVISLHEINKMSEVIFRLANFSRAIKNRLNDLGVDSLDQLDEQTKEDVLISAVASSRRILDFGQKGTASRLIEKGIAYKGVASQAAYSTGEQIRIRPIQMASALLQIASLPAIAVGMYNLLSIWADGEDDEPMEETWERYMKWRKYQISFNKKGYFHFYTGETNKDGIPNNSYRC